MKIVSRNNEIEKCKIFQEPILFMKLVFFMFIFVNMSRKNIFLRSGLENCRLCKSYVCFLCTEDFFIYSDIPSSLFSTFGIQWLLEKLHLEFSLRNPQMQNKLVISKIFFKIIIYIIKLEIFQNVFIIQLTNFLIFVYWF